MPHSCYVLTWKFLVFYHGRNIQLQEKEIIKSYPLTKQQLKPIWHTEQEGKKKRKEKKKTFISQ